MGNSCKSKNDNGQSDPIPQQTTSTEQDPIKGNNYTPYPSSFIQKLTFRILI